MEHALNLASYCRRRAAVALAAGNTEKAAELEATARKWEEAAR